MVNATVIHRNAVPNTKAISSSVLMDTILGLWGPVQPLQIHTKDAQTHSA